MAEEKTAQEAKQEKGARMVVVLRRCFTNIDHNPGDVVPWSGDLPETGIMRELTDDERDEYDAKVVAHRAQFGSDVAEEPQRVSVREEVIRQALAKLDPANDNDWLESGKPAMAAVNRELLLMGATPDTTSRAEILKVAPDFKRPELEGGGGAASDRGLDPVGMAPGSGVPSGEAD